MEHKKRKLPATSNTLLHFFKKKPGLNVSITILNYSKYLTLFGPELNVLKSYKICMTYFVHLL